MRKSPPMRLGNVPRMDLQAAISTRAFLGELVKALDKHCHQLIVDQQSACIDRALQEKQLTLPFVETPIDKSHR